MLAFLPLGDQPLSTLPIAAAATDDAIVTTALDDLFALEVSAPNGFAFDAIHASPLADGPVVVDDAIVAGAFTEFNFPGLSDDFVAAFDTWITAPFEDADGVEPPPPQPGPLSALGGAGWFADAPRRKKQKPTWPNLPAPSPIAAQSWRLVTVTRETARLRIHRSAKAMRAKLKRETSLEDHVISGIVAALIADQDKDD